MLDNALEVLASHKASKTAVLEPKPVTYDKREDLAEFHKALNKPRDHFVGFGDEANICRSWSNIWSCSQGHYILQTLSCNREWCPECGEDLSDAHKRRMARIMSRVFAMDYAGHMVLQVPLALRDQFRGKQALRDSRKYIHRLLKREFGCRGISRWHFFGTPTLEEFDADMDYTRYHPHLHLLIEQGFIGKKQIKRIRRLWSQWVYNYTGKQYYKTSPVNYKYYRASSKKYVLAKYITRPTFKRLNDYNIDIAKGIYRFTNTTWLGKFTPEDKARGLALYEAWRDSIGNCKGGPTLEVRAHESVANRICPICSSELKQIVTAVDLETGKLSYIDKTESYTARRDFGGGLFEVEPPSWAEYPAPPDMVKPAEYFRELELSEEVLV